MDAFERLGVKRTQGYALVKNGLFPPPIKREDRPSRVPSYEVDQVIAATIGGVSEENLRHLVSSLTEQRRNLLEEISNLSSEVDEWIEARIAESRNRSCEALAE